METVEERLKQKLFAIGVSTTKLADYCGGIIKKSALADGLAANNLPRETAQAVEEILDVMLLMRKQAGLPIDWTQSGIIRPILEERLREYREAVDPTPRYIFFARTSTTNFFQTIRGGQIITVPSEAKAAAFSSLELAEQCVWALKKRDVYAFSDRFTNTLGRKQSTLTTDLSQLGLENSKAVQQ